jgi:hypothetical protein
MDINNWLFKEPKNTVVFTTKKIARENEPILYVYHDEDDGAWQFHHGENVEIIDAAISALQVIVEMDTTINELSNLPVGWMAWRETSTMPWIRAQML